MNAVIAPSNHQPTPSLDVSGKRVVVVGGKVGIGLGIAKAARSAGADVVIASRRRGAPEDHPELAGFEQFTLDVREEEAVRSTFKAIGAFDHLVVAAGPEASSLGSFMDEDMRGVRGFVESKFLGTWACARYATPHIKLGGSMTFLTGGTGARPKVGLAAVTASYAAVEALSRSLALDVAPIRVNTIRPGFIDTDFWDTLPDADREVIKNKVRANFPARRVGVPADIGHAALFLMTNPYVTGTVIEVSGGELLVEWQF